MFNAYSYKKHAQRVTNVTHNIQDAQLSQRDRAAAWVSFGKHVKKACI